MSKHLGRTLLTCCPRISRLATHEDGQAVAELALVLPLLLVLVFGIIQFARAKVVRKPPNLF